MSFFNYTFHQTDLERQLEQARENADYLQQLLSEKDATLKQLQQELEEQTRENNKLQSDYDSMFNSLAISRFI